MCKDADARTNNTLNGNGVTYIVPVKIKKTGEGAFSVEYENIEKAKTSKVKVKPFARSGNVLTAKNWNAVHAELAGLPVGGSTVYWCEADADVPGAEEWTEELPEWKDDAVVVPAPDENAFCKPLTKACADIIALGKHVEYPVAKAFVRHTDIETLMATTWYPSALAALEVLQALVNAGKGRE